MDRNTRKETVIECLKSRLKLFDYRPIEIESDEMSIRIYDRERENYLDGCIISQVAMVANTFGLFWSIYPVKGNILGITISC